MLEISNVKVYDLKESVIASGFAMRTEKTKYTDEEFEKSLPRAIKLAKAGGGSGHSNFRKGIRVSFDIKYPDYISPELQRYHFVDIVCSSSKMHKLINMDMDLCFNKYVTQTNVDEMKMHVSRYNEVKKSLDKTHIFVLRDGTEIKTTGQDALYVAFIECVSNCPHGIELFMRCSTNYEQLSTIYKQRKHHKLKEDWGAFRDFIKSLPLANELILPDYE